jgi:hypothetical protein
LRSSGIIKVIKDVSTKAPKFELSDVELSIYPNPSNGLFYIHSENQLKNVTITIENTSGVIIHKSESNILEPNKQIILTNNRKGIYLVKIKCGSKTVVKKIVVN